MRRDWLQQLCLMYSIMLMRLQELYKTCGRLVVRPVILFCFSAKWQNSSAVVEFLLFYFILLQSGKIILFLLQIGKPL